MEKISISAGKPFDFDTSLKEFYQDKTMYRFYVTPACEPVGSYLLFEFDLLLERFGIDFAIVICLTRVFNRNFDELDRQLRRKLFS